MLVTKTITKKNLEIIVEETFSKFGLLNSSTLLDSLKLLGFYYATNAGISINIEDLKTPDEKKQFISKANDEIDFVSQQWQQGFVSDTERFQTIIDSWNIATESLKNRIVDYYQTLDPANNLYIMAFSGARGNMSQVRQLVGLRGLMSDQEGKIIDLPIQANFREGLNSIDYIISSYGARKGIVDTALKTADSGYLTRRLIYVAQDLVIRQADCKTKEGVIVLLKKKSNTKNILGRTLISFKSLYFPYKEIYRGDNILDNETLEGFKSMAPATLNVRSSLTCKANGSVCQKCYGWDLAHNRLISLGETVGIIAAQSIGEPGTQLTMRTFHTGGIFTGETLQQVNAPFSGKLFIPESLKTISYRTNHGVIVLKLQQEAIISIINWKGLKTDLFLEIGSFLYHMTSSFVKKGQLISEYSTQSIIPGARRLKPIYTSLAGEIKFENLLVRKMLRQQRTLNQQRTLKVNQDDGIVWIASGKIFSLPIEAEFLFPKILKKEKSLARLKIVSPFEGFIIFDTDIISIHDSETGKVIQFNFSLFSQSFYNCRIEKSLIVKNYQTIDKHTVIGFLEIYPQINAEIYAIRKKEANKISTFLIITEDDIWKINSDQLNNFSFFKEKKTIVRSGNLINTNSKFSRSGYFLKRDGFKMIFQHATPIFLSRGTILKYKQGDFVLEKKVFATLVNYTQQTEDIVQGLPKIEELIEARKPKIKCCLAKRPGIYLPSYFRHKEKQILKNNVLHIFVDPSVKNTWESLKHEAPYKIKKEMQLILISNSLQYRNNLYLFKNELFKPLSLLGSGNYCKFTYDKGILMINIDSKSYRQKMQQYKFNQIFDWKYITKQKKYFTKRFGHTLKGKVRASGNKLNANENSIFFEKLESTTKYLLPIYSNTLFDVGNFIDIGEPITEGTIDVHELLNILFQYHSNFDGIKIGSIRSLQKFQLILVNSIQSIYQSQGVNISSKHIEIIVRQMTSKVLIRNAGDTPLIKGELIRLSLMNEIYDALKLTDSSVTYKTPKYEPILMSATNASLSKDGFLSASGFQETKRILTKAAIEGSSDWLRGLKECIIIGRLIPAGSSFLNYKHYLDTLFFFKEKKNK